MIITATRIGMMITVNIYHVFWIIYRFIAVVYIYACDWSFYPQVQPHGLSCCATAVLCMVDIKEPSLLSVLKNSTLWLHRLQQGIRVVNNLTVQVLGFPILVYGQSSLPAFTAKFVYHFHIMHLGRVTTKRDLCRSYMVHHNSSSLYSIVVFYNGIYSSIYWKGWVPIKCGW